MVGGFQGRSATGSFPGHSSHMVTFPHSYVLTCVQYHILTSSHLCGLACTLCTLTVLHSHTFAHILTSSHPHILINQSMLMIGASSCVLVYVGQQGTHSLLTLCPPCLIWPYEKFFAQRLCTASPSSTLVLGYHHIVWSTCQGRKSRCATIL